MVSRTGVNRHTAARWRRRLGEAGLDALWEIKAGRGRKPRHGPEKVAALVEATLHSKPEGSTHWSCRTMARARGLSKATVNRIWLEYNLEAVPDAETLAPDAAWDATFEQNLRRTALARVAERVKPMTMQATCCSATSNPRISSSYALGPSWPTSVWSRRRAARCFRWRALPGSCRYMAPARAPATSSAPAVALSSDCRLAAGVLASDVSNRVVVWETENGRLLGETPLASACLAFSSDNSRLAVGHSDGATTVIRLKPFAIEALLPGALAPSPVQALAFGADLRVPLQGPGPERRWLLGVGHRGAGIVIWDLSARLPRSFCHGSTWEVQSVAFHPDGITLASAGRMGVRFWDVMSGRHLLLTLENGSDTRALAFNEDGSLLVSGTTAESSPADVCVWEVEADRGVQRLRGLSAPARKVWFSPDDRWVAALSDEWLLGMWDVATGRERAVHVTGTDNGWFVIQADPTGCWAAIFEGSGSMRWRLIELTSGHPGDRLPYYLALGPGAGLLASFDSEANYSLLVRADWSGAAVPLDADGEHLPDTYTFSYDGRRVAWGCTDGAVIVADLELVTRKLESLPSPPSRQGG